MEKEQNQEVETDVNTQENESDNTTESQDETEGGSADDAATGESTNNGDSEAGNDKAKRAQSQIDRLKKQLEDAKAELKKQGKEGGKEDAKLDEKYARLDLKTEGVTSKKEQDVILEYAEWKGVDHSEAMKSPAVKAELAELRKKESVPAPSSRTSSGANNSFEYWSAQAKKGNFPKGDKEMMRKLRAARIFSG